MQPRDWVQWHRQYQDTESALSRRLACVVDCVRRLVSATDPGPVTILSLCAGDGRDVISALTGHERARDARGALIELDPVLAGRARRALADAGLSRFSVRIADAGSSRAWADLAPADVVLACGVFGNITEADVHRLIRHMPAVCAPGGSVVWTRHRRSPDRTPTIRRWFEDAAFEPGSFVSPGPDSWSVGVQHRPSDAPLQPLPPDLRLFSFR